MDILRDPIWQTVGVIIALIGGLTAFVGFVLSNSTARKEKAKLIGTVSVISVFVCLVIVGIIFLPQLVETVSAHIPPSNTPTQALTAYCNALNTRDYSTAWDQVSSEVQKKETESQFAASVSQFTDCKVKSVDDKSAFGILSVKTTNNTTEPGPGIGGDGDYRYTMIIENGAWKINSACEILPQFGGQCVG